MGKGTAAAQKGVLDDCECAIATGETLYGPGTRIVNAWVFPTKASARPKDQRQESIKPNRLLTLVPPIPPGRAFVTSFNKAAISGRV
jgi:hypothetical protein